MRMTIHNGRAGKNGTYSPKHNDRNFDISSAEHIDPERMPGNVYWNWTGEKDMSFEDCEKAFYEEHCREYLDAVNRRHREQRHPERVRDMDAYRTARQTCPEETLLMIGNKDEHLPPKTLRAICEDLRNWEENTVPGLRVLDMALHVDEQGAPHIHMRRAWIYRDENGIESIAQSKTLQAAGIPLPHPDKPQGRHNNRKQSFSAMERQALYEICRGYGIESLLEMQPRERSRSGREMEDYKAEQAEKRAKAAEMRAKMAEEKTRQAETSLDKIKGAKTHAQKRTQQAQERAREQEGKNNALRATESEIRGKMEREQTTARQLAEMNQKARQELQQVQKQLEVLKPYLSRAEQKQLEEQQKQLEQEWDEPERD
jgi:hypothetical protein